jgi:hypothetical protein
MAPLPSEIDKSGMKFVPLLSARGLLLSLLASKLKGARYVPINITALCSRCRWLR